MSNAFGRVRTLTQNAARMHAVGAADSLVGGLVAFATNPAVNARLAIDAVKLIQEADSAFGAKTYAGSVPSLGRIFREARDTDVRKAALQAFGQLADSMSAFAFLETVAKSKASPDTAGAGLPLVALQTLARRGGPAATRILRSLNEQGLVVQPGARQWLGSVAKQGYRMPAAVDAGKGRGPAKN